MAENTPEEKKWLKEGMILHPEYGWIWQYMLGDDQ